MLENDFDVLMLIQKEKGQDGNKRAHEFNRPTSRTSRMGSQIRGDIKYFGVDNYPTVIFLVMDFDVIQAHSGLRWLESTRHDEIAQVCYPGIDAARMTENRTT